MFKFNCPYCRQAIEAEDSWVGQIAECPKCGKSVEIKRPSRPSFKPLTQSAHTEEPQDEGRVMDFLMGMALPGLGLVLAAIVGGRKGLKHAFLGFWLLVIIAIAIHVIIAVLP